MKLSKTILVTTALVSLVFSSASEAATIRELSVINDNVVRLGDVFEGVEKADTVLGTAPVPGKDMVLNSRTLKRIATAYNVAWKPESGAEYVTVRRDAHMVDTAAITETLKAALVEKGVEGDIDITLNSSKAQIVLPGNLDPTVEVTSLDYTPGKDVFTATLAAPSAAKPVKTITVSGLMSRKVQVPVLNSTFKAGDVIGSGDIAWTEIPERLVTKDIVLDADTLIGKTPSKFIQNGRPLRSTEIKSPQLVNRGDEVTIQYNMGGMMLTAKGKSLQSGAAGEIIRVTNVASNKPMSGKVTGDRVITVQ